MDLHTLFESQIFTLVILPLLIFLSRIVDVSIGTMRLIFISRGYKLFAAFLGFFEVLIWVVAITQVLSNLTNIFYYLAYGAGFATGNYVGMVIEEKIALGNVLLRVITRGEPLELIEFLKKDGFGFTRIEAEGAEGTVRILFTIMARQDLEPVVSFIREKNPNAFYTIEDVRYINQQHFSFKNTLRNRRLRFFYRAGRKGK